MMLRTTLAGFALALTVAAAAAACPGSPTPSLTAGPFYREGSPRRTVLREGSAPGRRLLLTGVVYDDRCRPLAGAWVDFWQADGEGRYDNSGYGFRGQQLTDSAGRYTLDTVVPAEYPGRTPHIHVKVRAPGAPAGQNGQRATPAARRLRGLPPRKSRRGPPLAFPRGCGRCSRSAARFGFCCL